MLTHCASNIIGSAYPYRFTNTNNYGMQYVFRQGLSYSPKRNTTEVKDLLNGSSFGVANNVSNDYYPSRYGGMVYLNNTTGYNPGAGKTIFCNDWFMSYVAGITIIVAWEYVASNLTYGADIIVGAYYGGTTDWWIGQSGYSASAPYRISRNGVGYELGTAPVAGRRYIAVFGNNPITNTGYYYLFDSNGGSYSNTSIGGVDISDSGVIGIGKYGEWNDNYLPRIYVGDFIASDEYLSTTTALAIKDRIKYRYGISV